MAILIFTLAANVRMEAGGKSMETGYLFLRRTVRTERPMAISTVAQLVSPMASPHMITKNKYENPIFWSPLSSLLPPIRDRLWRKQQQKQNGNPVT
jgi:hypothetical protein